MLATAGVLLLLTSIIVHSEGDEDADTAVVPEVAAAHVEINSGFERLKPIFKDGCFDCHSNQTDFPWYHSLPIIKGWLDEHVAEARDELDFSSGFPFGGHHKRQADNLLKIKRELEAGAMPLRSYRFMHWGAAPNAEEKDSIYAWVDRSLILLASHGQYPFNKPENVPPAR
jgi:hypothetical protein